MLRNVWSGNFTVFKYPILIGCTSIVVHILCALFNNDYTAIFGARGEIIGIMSSIIMINGAKDVSLPKLNYAPFLFVFIDAYCWICNSSH